MEMTDRDENEITELYQDAINYPERFRGMTYAQGVRAALDWVFNGECGTDPWPEEEQKTPMSD